MNPAKDALYQVHQVQAQRRGRSALHYDAFCARLHETYETDLTKLLLPSTEVKLNVQVTPSRCRGTGTGPVEARAVKTLRVIKPSLPCGPLKSPPRTFYLS